MGIDGWQPIETAPKDGTWFVAARFVKGCEYVRYGYAKIDRWHEIGGLDQFNKKFWPATHWMPLPPPPTKDSHHV